MVGVGVGLGPPVITRVRPAGAATRKIPFPDGSWFMVDALASIFGVTRKTIWNKLSEHRAQLGPPRYRPLSPHDKRLRRIVSTKDKEFLATLFPVYERVRQEK